MPQPLNIQLTQGQERPTVNDMQIVSTSALNPSPLRAVRVAMGMTLRATAHASGIDPGHLSKVERGEKQLSIESLHRLAVVLELFDLAENLKPFLCDQESA
jgi:transcriptional regulator with XRE-family HTH domain